MIRDADVSDIPAMLAMGKAFADDAGVTANIGWDDESVKRLLGQLIESPDGILMVADNAMIGGLIYAHPYSGERVFQEMFWRSHGSNGIRLLKAAEKQAKERGAIRSIMIGMDTMPDTAGLYARLNYKPMERLYSKEL